MKNIKLVIFDWDGTLCNSIDTIVSSLQFTADKFGYQISNQQAKDVIGLALPIALDTLFPTDDAEQRQQIFDTYVEHNVPHSAHDAWYDGALTMLQDLKQRGILLAVATGKARKGLNRVFERMPECGDIFITSRCADEALSKPNPLMLEQILTELNLTAEQAIMVGDSVYDVQMAKNINMQAIGITHGVHSAEILQPYADVIVDNIEQLHQTLVQML